jgi:hypothetical protein
VLLEVLSLLWLMKSRRLSPRDTMNAAVSFALLLGIVLLPWLTYKWMHGLPFGNAKSVASFTIGWQPWVWLSIIVNTFFEGNWLFLFPVLFGLLIAEKRFAFRSALVIPVAFFLMVYVGQIILYLFTTLGAEALMQTGYARGIIHLVPVMVLISTILLSHLWNKLRPRPNSDDGASA